MSRSTFRVMATVALTMLGMRLMQGGEWEFTTLEEGSYSSFQAPSNDCSSSSSAKSPLLVDETRAMATPQFDSVTFVFLMGIEGTGHHFFSALIEESPIYQDMEDAKGALKDLRFSLYSHLNQSYSLWGYPQSKLRPPQDTTVMDQVVRCLQAANLAFQGKEVSHVPLNAALMQQKGVGFLSYPNFFGDSRYPDVGPLYDACTLAKVNCEHIYLYRNPYAVIKSTTMNRNFHKKNKAVHLYTGLLNVIQGQLLDHPARIAACWDYDDTSFENEGLWEVGQMFGWKSRRTFFNACENLRLPSTTSSQETLSTIIPPNLRPYMSSMIRAHNRAKETCHVLLQHRTDPSEETE